MRFVFRHPLSTLAFAMPWLLFPARSLAQMGTDTVTLAPIVVTATLVPMRVDQISATVTVLSGDALRARGIATVADALRSVPGATVVATGSFGGQTSVFLRGGESDYAKVLIDGVPQNQPGGFFDFANLGIEDVDRIEIVRGPGSVLYGSDAVTGVIQIFTRSGRGALAGRLSGGGGSYGTRWGTAELEGSAGTWSYGMTVSRHATDGIYPINNRYHRDIVSGRARVRPDAGSEIQLAARWIEGVYHFPTDYVGRIADSNQATTARGPSISLEATRLLTSRLTAHLLMGSHAEQDAFDDGPDSPGDTGASCCFHSRDDTRRLVGRGWVDLRLPGGAVVTGGVEFEHQRQTGTTLSAARHDAAWFAQLLGRLTDAGTFTVGGRVDRNQTFGTHLTGRAGLSWRLTPTTRLRGSAGTGFKEPSFYENFATGFVRGNPALRPEQSASWEIAVEQSLVTGRLLGSITYFDQHFRDLVQYSSVPLGLDSVNYANVDAATARGAEVSIRGTLGRELALDASLSRTRTRDASTGRRLLRRPTNGAHVRLAWAPRWGQVAVSAAYTGNRDDLDYRGSAPAAVTLPGHTRVAAALIYRVTAARSVTPGLAATLRVENLFDARYEEAVGFPAPGRTVLVGAELRFGR